MAGCTIHKDDFGEVGGVPRGLRASVEEEGEGEEEGEEEGEGEGEEYFFYED
jgi:hypothetical protein